MYIHVYKLLWRCNDLKMQTTCYYIYIYIYIYTYTCTYTYVNSCGDAMICKCNPRIIIIYVCVCVHTCTYTCVHTDIHVYIYIYTCT